MTDDSQQQLDTITGDDTDGDTESVEWKSLSVFLEGETKNRFTEDFITELKYEHKELRPFDKRIFQQALVEVIIEEGIHEEVAERAYAHDEELDKDESDWAQVNLYLKADVRRSFNNTFFMELMVEDEGLQDLMKRVLQNAAIAVGMEHDSEIAAKAVEVHERYD